MQRLPIPEPGSFKAQQYVSDHLDGLYSGPVVASETIRGGQSEANSVISDLDITGYGKSRFTAYPVGERGATVVSPYVNAGLLTLHELWAEVDESKSEASSVDAASYRNELVWQEYARHWLARLGSATKTGTKREIESPDSVKPIDRRMGCMDLVMEELEDVGHLVNEARLWFASHWVATGNSWQSGQEYFYSHLLDGSHGPNRLGWQWATGVGSEKHYKLTRWHVEERAQGLCASCELVTECPIDYEQPDPIYIPAPNSAVAEFDEANFGPKEAVTKERDIAGVMLNPSSMGDKDPALVAHPDAPCVFVFDEETLGSQALSSKRLCFWIETLADLAQRRSIEIYRGSYAELVKDRPMATTFIPDVESLMRESISDFAEIYPWAWLVEPADVSVNSFSAWSKASNVANLSHLTSLTSPLSDVQLP